MGDRVIRVLIADDERLVRAGFRRILDDESDIEVVAEAGDGVEAVAEAAASRPDVVLMDMRMPVVNGIEATRRIVVDETSPRVLVLTTFDLDEYVYSALQAGASGFLLKDAPEDQLLAAIRVVSAGGALFSPSVTRRLIDEFASSRVDTNRPRASRGSRRSHPARTRCCCSWHRACRTPRSLPRGSVASTPRRRT